MFPFFNKKKAKPITDFSIIGTDVHSHLLPGIDDGSPDIATSLALISALANLGFTKIYTTPHVMSGFYPNTRSIILKKRDEVLQALENEAIGLDVFDAAAEYYIDETFVDLMKKEPLLTLPGNRVLVEMSFHHPYPDVHKVVFDLQMKGYAPILAHPERYPYYQTVEDYERLKAMGCLLQVNLLSLAGYYGRPVQTAAQKMLDNQFIDLLATDLHHERHAFNLRGALTDAYVTRAVNAVSHQL